MSTGRMLCTPFLPNEKEEAKRSASPCIFPYYFVIVSRYVRTVPSSAFT